MHTRVTYTVRDFEATQWTPGKNFGTGSPEVARWLTLQGYPVDRQEQIGYDRQGGRRIEWYPKGYATRLLPTDDPLNWMDAAEIVWGEDWRSDRDLLRKLSRLSKYAWQAYQWNIWKAPIEETR